MSYFFLVSTFWLENYCPMFNNMDRTLQFQEIDLEIDRCSYMDFLWADGYVMSNIWAKKATSLFSANVMNQSFKCQPNFIHFSLPPTIFCCTEGRL